MSWRADMGLPLTRTDTPPHKAHNAPGLARPEAPGWGSADSADSAEGVESASTTRPDLDAAELRHRFDERAAVYQFDGGLPRAEAEVRAWAEVALDVVEADPAINALGNAEARARAARVLHAAGIPAPPATPLRLVAAPAPRRDEPPRGYSISRVLDNGLPVYVCEKCHRETVAGPRFHRCKGGPSRAS